ncbi:MAG: hypothetical protein QOF49_888 [Chloroflexota bacterium]|jgi:hypothetical protein|nr:hypothetical protein [Chloroflexota bacterium]
MFVIGIGFLALFSLVSIVLGNDDPRHTSDPRDDLSMWMRFGAR